MSIIWNNRHFLGPYEVNQVPSTLEPCIFVIMVRNDPVNNPESFQAIDFGYSKDIDSHYFTDHTDNQKWKAKSSREGKYFVGLYHPMQSEYQNVNKLINECKTLYFIS